MNAAAVAKEAETVTVTAKERKNESDHDLARDHARHLPHDQQLHGHAQALQQQSSAIKKKNRVDKAAHQVRTKLFSLCARFKRLEIEKELYFKNCCNTSKFNNAFFLDLVWPLALFTSLSTSPRQCSCTESRGEVEELLN